MPFGASALFAADVLSRGGDGDMPVGEAMDAGNMNSSRFIRSGVLWSIDCLNLAMPEGALDLCWVKLFQTRVSRAVHLAQVRSHGSKGV